MDEDNNFVKYHIACDKCGSSDARSVNKNGRSYCFSCNTYFPPEQTNIKEGDDMGIQAVQTKPIVIENNACNFSSIGDRCINGM